MNHNSCSFQQRQTTQDWATHLCTQPYDTRYHTLKTNTGMSPMECASIFPHGFKTQHTCCHRKLCQANSLGSSGSEFFQTQGDSTANTLPLLALSYPIHSQPLSSGVSVPSHSCVNNLTPNSSCPGTSWKPTMGLCSSKVPSSSQVFPFRFF